MDGRGLILPSTNYIGGLERSGIELRALSRRLGFVCFETKARLPTISEGTRRDLCEEGGISKILSTKNSGRLNPNLASNADISRLRKSKPVKESLVGRKLADVIYQCAR